MKLHPSTIELTTDQRRALERVLHPDGGLLDNDRADCWADAVVADALIAIVETCKRADQVCRRMGAKP